VKNGSYGLACFPVRVLRQVNSGRNTRRSFPILLFDFFDWLTLTKPAYVTFRQPFSISRAPAPRSSPRSTMADYKPPESPGYPHPPKMLPSILESAARTNAGTT
jgi:hypothetical protein